MPDKLDMSLDEIIKKNKTEKGSRGGRGRGGRGTLRSNLRGRGLGRRPFGGGIAKRRSAGSAGGVGGARPGSNFRAAAKVPDGQWVHDLYGGQVRGGLRRSGSGAISTGPSKIVISNLDFGVNDKDIKDLFEEFGAIRKAAVHYDRSGRSLGTADVIFEKKQDAVKAMKKYNGVQLDGRPMDIQLATNLTQAPVSAPSGGAGVQHSNNNRNGSTASFARRGGFGGGRGARRGGRGGAAGGRGGGQQKTAKTAAELDAELDSYTAKMDTE